MAEICARLDGLPLAIELAAARIQAAAAARAAGAPGAALAAADRRRRVTLPARQQTLRAAIAWSYDLLTAPEQRLFRRLAVFVGGCTLEAAEVIGCASGETQMDVLQGITRLLDGSLLRTESEPGGDLRLGMLETIREFALEQLASNGELDSTRYRHAAYFAAMAEQAASPRLDGPHGPALLARLERDHDNLLAALRWLLERGDAERSTELAGALWSFWETRAYKHEGLALLESCSRSGRGCRHGPCGRER